ncbi:MAG: N-carbamoylputrescine amidase [Bacilli bacterium]|nr:N-carbamoylputrescine amidase [Bacilli bacterium]
MRKVTLAATQFACTESYQDNIKKADEIIKKAAEKGANVILLQELFERKYFCQIEDYKRFEYAEEYENSKTLSHFQEVAKKYKVVLPISFFEKSGNCYFNSICVINSKGEKLGVYRKTHIPTGENYEEKFYFNPGDTGFKVFKTEYGRIGIGICWDQWFLETGRSLALKGAEYLLFPTAIGSEPVLPIDSMPHWRNAMIGQSALNILPVVASNRIGVEDDVNSSMTFFGSSFITDETGCLVESADRVSETILVHTFDLDECEQRRRDWGIYRDRRPEMYSFILKYDDSK